MREFANLKGFARTVSDLLLSDRDVTVGVAGFTGEGKTTFATKLARAYCEIMKLEWTFSYMTWSRKEMMRWIDGEGKEKEGRLPEYSVIIPDELFLMFYRRNWYENSQVDAIGTLNMCRDRHLFIIGNVPNLWDLDSAFLSRIRFYVYIPERGKAWVFQQENNPFGNDPWNVNENRKIFRKEKNPFKCPNFVCEIAFDDWDEKEKAEYYNIRNEKRIMAIKEVQNARGLRAKKMFIARRRLIKWIYSSLFFENDKGEYVRPTQAMIAEYGLLFPEQVSDITQAEMPEYFSDSSDSE